MFPSWLETEDTVRGTFELLGFKVEKVSISGRQIDIVAKKYDVFNFDQITWVVEVTTERVGEGKGSSDYQKLSLAKKHYGPSTRLMVVTTAGFTDDQKATLRELEVVPLTFSEFEESVINLKRYAGASLTSISGNTRPDIGYDPTRYIEPLIEVQNGTTTSSVFAEKWVDDFLQNHLTSGAYALLANLGTGKTSLLTHIHKSACESFIRDPDNKPITVLIPLGQFKQHSGHIDQMIMHIFMQSGIDNYPAPYISHLIKNKRIILLLDGLDEIHPIQNTDDILSTVINIFDQISGKGRAIISSRRELFSSTAEEIAYFGSHTAPKIADIQAKLATALRGHGETHIVSLMPFDQNRINAYLAKRCGMSLSEISKFFETFYGFLDMAKTPVLLSMMATAIEQNLIDPLESYYFPILTLYEKYTERWIERDLERAKLSPGQRRQLSERLADHMMWAGLNSETWTYVVKVLKDQPEWNSGPVSEDEAEIDIRKSGFLVRDLDDQYRFNHRSIQEFFAAKVEFERLKKGERPRHMPSDGFRMFLSTLMADAWLHNNTPPLVPDPANNGQSDTARAQISFLAAATKMLPDGSSVSFEHRQPQHTKGELRWKQVNFHNCTMRHAGNLHFHKCTFANCEIDISDFSDAEFKECSFKNTTIKFDRMPNWADHRWTAGGVQRKLDLPGYIWDLACIANDGASVFINGQKWTLTWSMLSLCDEVWQKVHKKTLEKNFISGSFSKELDAILPLLKREGWVDADASREEISITGTAKFRTTLAKLRAQPFSAQGEFSIFLL